MRLSIKMKRFVHLAQIEVASKPYQAQIVEEEAEDEMLQWFQIKESSIFYSRWQFNMSIWLWASVFLVPLILVWNTVLDQTGPIKVIIYAADSMFIINIPISFVVIRLRPDVEPYSVWKNAKEYLKSWFLLDLIICLPALSSNQAIWS